MNTSPSQGLLEHPMIPANSKMSALMRRIGLAPRSDLVVATLIAAAMALGACDREGHAHDDGHNHDAPNPATTGQPVEHEPDHAEPEEPAHTELDGHGHDGDEDPGHAESIDHSHDEAGSDLHPGHAHEPGDDHAAEPPHVDEVTLTADAIERYAIRTQRAERRVLTPTMVVPARVGFNTEAMAHVGASLQGRVVEITARLGDDVAAGDILALVESPELGREQTEYLERRTAVDTAAPMVELARDAWDRARDLYEGSQGISLTEVQRREAEHAAAIATRRTAEAALLGAEHRLRLLGMTGAQLESLSTTASISPRYAILAPISGRVVDREVTLGELVGPDREPLLVLADMTTLWVLANVPEARLAEVAIGARSWVATGAIGGSRFEGRVALIAAMIDPATRTAHARIEVPSSGFPMRPGMFAQVEIEAIDPAAGSRSTVVCVPEEAVQTVEGGPAVFVPVPGEPGTFALRPVAIGRVIGGMIPVLAGLEEGEEFVASGSFILKAELGKAGAAHQH